MMENGLEIQKNTANAGNQTKTETVERRDWLDNICGKRNRVNISGGN